MSSFQILQQVKTFITFLQNLSEFLLWLKHFFSVTASTLALNSNWPSSILECKQHWVNKTSTLLSIKLVIKTWHSKVHAPKLCSPGVLTSLTWIANTIESKMLEQLMNTCFDLIFQLDITEWQTIENKLYVAVYLVSFKE